MLLIQKRIMIVNKFKGILNRLIMVDLCDSGTWKLRSVAIDGKYRPRLISNTMNAMKQICLWNGQTLAWSAQIATNMWQHRLRRVERDRMEVAGLVLIFCLKMMEPSMMEIMKVEKTNPNDTEVCPCKIWFWRYLIYTSHLKHALNS